MNKIIKFLNQIIDENKPYNLRLFTSTFNKFHTKISARPLPGICLDFCSTEREYTVVSGHPL